MASRVANAKWTSESVDQRRTCEHTFLCRNLLLDYRADRSCCAVNFFLRERHWKKNQSSISSHPKCLPRIGSVADWTCIVAEQRESFLNTLLITSLMFFHVASGFVINIYNLPGLCINGQQNFTAWTFINAVDLGCLVTRSELWESLRHSCHQTISAGDGRSEIRVWYRCDEGKAG